MTLSRILTANGLARNWNKVLIVDDEPTVRWALAEALRG